MEVEVHKAVDQNAECTPNATQKDGTPIPSAALEECDNHPDQKIKNRDKEEAETDYARLAGEFQIVVMGMVNLHIDQFGLEGAEGHSIRSQTGAQNRVGTKEADGVLPDHGSI